MDDSEKVLMKYASALGGILANVHLAEKAVISKQGALDRIKLLLIESGVLNTEERRNAHERATHRPRPVTGMASNRG
jgi:hypothetical protein